MRALLGTIVCKFGSDPATSVVEVAICAKFTDRHRQTDGRTDRRTDGQTDGRRTPRDCISSWNELKKTTYEKPRLKRPRHQGLKTLSIEAEA